MEQRKATLKLERLPADDEDQWRSKQFHAVHLYRVRAAAGLPSNKEGELSCSSCHATRNPIDLATPRTTCAKCHNGQRDARAGRQVIASDKPNCTSCHVQHPRDQRHWNPSLLSVRTGSGSDRIIGAAGETNDSLTSRRDTSRSLWDRNRKFLPPNRAWL
jgi:hypothetical protein